MAEQQPSSFVPVGELGSGNAAASHADPIPAAGGSPAAATGSEGDEPSSLQPSAMERPVSAAGYESGDDMDLLSMQHCTNCTGPLWGHICMDCGHMTAHDDDIFSPTVAPAAALHRPRLQVSAACCFLVKSSQSRLANVPPATRSYALRCWAALRPAWEPDCRAALQHRK